MTEQAPRRTSGRNLGLAALAALCAAGTLACGGSSLFEISIETPIQPKLDVSAFQRVLVAGFVAGGTDDMDANQETVRLLRSQLRAKSSLRIIDADALPLVEIAQDQNKAQNKASSPSAAPPEGASQDEADGPAPLPEKIKDEKDLEPYERLFANTAYWKTLGEEYQNPLIVTGTMLFMPNQTAGFVQRDSEQFDSFGRRVIVPVRAYVERKGFLLRWKYIFIDGNTGATIYSESYRDEVLYNTQQNMPALSSYFEIMDRLLPNFLSALSSQKIKGTRVLLR